MLQLFFLLTSPIYGLNDSAVVRIGLYLGGNKPQKAMRTATLYAMTLGVLIVTVGSYTFFDRHQLGHYFSSDPRVWAATAQIASLAAVGYALLGSFYYSL